MKYALIAAVGVAMALTVQQPVRAQTVTCDNIGGRQFCHGPNGYSSTQDEIGGRTFGHDNQGNSWTTDQLGGRSFTNVQPGFHRGW
jgi:hypothetical protein